MSIGYNGGVQNIAAQLYLGPLDIDYIDKLDTNLENLGSEGGVIYTGNPKILKKICPGVFGTIKPIGICMIGSR